MVSIVRILVTYDLVTSALFYLADAEDVSSWSIFEMISLIVPPNIPACISLLFTGLPMYILAELTQDISHHLARNL